MKCICRFLRADEDGKLQLVKKPFFEIPLSIMDIWYTQALMWYVFLLVLKWRLLLLCTYIYRLGFFYSPYLPLITIATLVLHFYVRRVRKIGHYAILYIT